MHEEPFSGKHASPTNSYLFNLMKKMNVIQNVLT